MLKLPLTHPQLLEALASAGHGSTILVADGHYPVATASHPLAPRVFLNLRPGVVDATSVLDCIVAVTPIEAVVVMAAAGLEDEPPIWAEYRRILTASGKASIELEEVDRDAFYELARRPDLAVAIATGEEGIYANLLLTIGVRADLDRRIKPRVVSNSS
jgi:L-fucose mutarotase